MNNFMKHDFSVSKITMACCVKAGTGQNVHNNRPSHGLAFFPDGDRTIVFSGGKKLSVKENTVVYFPKGSDYVIKNKIVTDCYAINFDMEDSIVFEPFAFRIKDINSVMSSFKVSNRIWTKKSVGYNTKVKAELFNIIYIMQSEYCLPYRAKSYEKITPALDYIHSNYCKEPLSVENLAQKCNISSAYMRNIFIKNFGVSPIRYINNLKMIRAGELLASGFYTVSEVCFLSGFNDESYFSREFKKHFSVSPIEYKCG